MDELENGSKFLFYNDAEGKISVQVIVGDETVWTTQNGMAEIFDVDRTGISRHVKNIFEEEEVSEKSNVQYLHVANSDKLVAFYSLEVIISVGYRVNSFKATRFRQWASRILKEYLVKGFALDDERLKQGNNLFNKDYFKELLERIRDIRTSERMFYEQVKEIFATSVDYDKKAPEALTFFSTIQNKLEYAVAGKTSAEIIRYRANSELPNMNLQTWRNLKNGRGIQKSDVTVAKNYLTEAELNPLKLLVTMFLDYAELQAQRNKLMKMADWIQKVDDFLRFNDYKVLTNAGSIRKEVADKFAQGEYEKYKALTPPSMAYMAVLNDIKSSGEVPKETGSEENKMSDFDSKLKHLLTITPPKRDKSS